MFSCLLFFDLPLKHQDAVKKNFINTTHLQSATSTMYNRDDRDEMQNMSLDKYQMTTSILIHLRGLNSGSKRRGFELYIYTGTCKL